MHNSFNRCGLRFASLNPASDSRFPHKKGSTQDKGKEGLGPIELSFGPLQMGQGRALVLKVALVVIFCLQGGHQLQGLTALTAMSQGWSWPLCFFREYNVSWNLLRTLLLIGSGHEARRVSLLLPSAPPSL
jgi:hypothetical protein